MKRFIIINFLLVASLACSGCAVVLRPGRRADVEKIRILEKELAELQQTQNVLQQKLSGEIADKQVRLSLEDKGLVITFVAEVLFDSGRSTLKPGSLATLNKVVDVLNTEAAEYDIGVEGYTDNVPIKYSKWKSNWELSAHRALEVLHYLETQGVDPERLSASGYGEYKPVASNDTKEGRKLNRRVEIVIFPKQINKVNKEDARKGELENYEMEELK